MRTDIKPTVRNNFHRTHLQFEVIGSMSAPICTWVVTRSGSVSPKYEKPKKFWRIPIDLLENGYYMLQELNSPAIYSFFFSDRKDK